MRILITGAAGKVGNYAMRYLQAHGHDLTAVDLMPIPAKESTEATIDKNGTVELVICDLTDSKAVMDLFASRPVFDGVVHFGAISDPLSLDARVVHNNNVTSHYNVLSAAVEHKVLRLVTASSVNAIGLGFSRPGHKILETVPITEEASIAPVSILLSAKSLPQLTLFAGRSIFSFKGVRVMLKLHGPILTHLTP